MAVVEFVIEMSCGILKRVMICGCDTMAHSWSHEWRQELRVCWDMSGSRKMTSADKRLILTALLLKNMRWRPAITNFMQNCIASFACFNGL